MTNWLGKTLHAFSDWFSNAGRTIWHLVYKGPVRDVTPSVTPTPELPEYDMGNVLTELMEAIEAAPVERGLRVNMQINHRKLVALQIIE